MADRDTYRLKAFDTIIEWPKQILTFAAAILVLSATFIRTIVPDPSEIVGELLLFISWFALLSSIMAGVVFMGKVAHTLDSATDTGQLNIWKSQTVGLFQVILFFAGIVAFLVFVYCNLTLNNVDKISADKNEATTIAPAHNGLINDDPNPPSELNESMRTIVPSD